MAAALLGPFLSKPFNMDDPLFIWAAQHIRHHPFDPYGFEVNWEETLAPMWRETENPPLASYYMALAGSILGWSEAALHGAFLLPAIAVVLGTYRLARHCCDRPMLAACAALFTPVFLVSSTTVMCDDLMLAFWVWALVWWVEGMEQGQGRKLAGAGTLMALAALTKYFGICLAPLLAVYSLTRKPRTGRWVVALLIPIAALGLWQWATVVLYRQGHVFRALQYANRHGDFPLNVRLTQAFTALTFTGGCLATVIFMAPWLWRSRTLIALWVAALLLALAVFYQGAIWHTYYWIQDLARLGLEAQIIFWSAGGLFVLALAGGDVRRRRDAMAWLLALWILGTFVFAAIINWTVNGRTLLPMAPAAGILLARRWQDCATANRKMFGWIVPSIFTAALALLVARSDFLLAQAVRQSAEKTYDRYGRNGHTIWFQGHWGFQYYLKKLGGREADPQRAAPQIGDVLAVPVNNTSLNFPPGPRAGFFTPGPGFLTDQTTSCGAGFYSALAGPVPFAFGPVPPEFVVIYTLNPAPPRPP